MEKEYVVLEGKVFVVELLSYLGSANYGWCISKLPEQLIVMGTENIHVGGRGSATTLQRFYFGAVSAEPADADISFTMNCWSKLSDVAENFTAKVRIVASNSEEFVSYSENMENIAIPYGYTYANNSMQNSCQDYGLPYDRLDVAEKYGYPCGVQDANLKYGYPCGMQDANLKYGYPCGVQDANLKYGYPCGMQDANLKYGYPCGMQDTNLKYGYPCGMQDANLKYGYPCGMQDANLKYGYPCGAQDAVLKYGYPCGAPGTIVAYGYPCMEYTKETRPYGFPY